MAIKTLKPQPSFDNLRGTCDLPDAYVCEIMAIRRHHGGRQQPNKLNTGERRDSESLTSASSADTSLELDAISSRTSFSTLSTQSSKSSHTSSAPAQEPNWLTGRISGHRISKQQGHPDRRALFVDDLLASSTLSILSAIEDGEDDFPVYSDGSSAAALCALEGRPYHSGVLKGGQEDAQMALEGRGQRDGDIEDEERHVVMLRTVAGFPCDTRAPASGGCRRHRSMRARLAEAVARARGVFEKKRGVREIC